MCRARASLEKVWFLVGVYVGMVSLTFLVSIEVGAAPARSRLALPPAVTAELTSLLSAGDSLHQALIKQDDEQVEVALKDIELALKRTVSASVVLRPYERSHLLKLLEATQEHSELARASGHADRRERLIDIFNNMANFVRIYSVDARFKIFFCGKDRMTWVQTRARGQHPFPEMMDRDCALRAP